MRVRNLVGAAILAGVLTSATEAQAPAPPPVSVAVGDKAPDFAAPGATRFGTIAQPVRLSEHRGKTVVLAFFPRARTRGCTVQMESYRDKYASHLRGGRDVVLMAISSDADTTLASWAREQDFPVLFVSDAAGEVGRAFGVWDEQRRFDRRVLFVIDPSGVVQYVANPFRELTEDAYTELRDVIARVAGPAAERGGP